MPRCKYCAGPLRKGKFENHVNFAARDYCLQPKCLNRGKRHNLEQLYAKENDSAARKLNVAYITRAAFISRWGMEPIRAFDLYGKEASDDWEHVYIDKVLNNKVLRVRVRVVVEDAEGQELATREIDEVILDRDATPRVAGGILNSVYWSLVGRTLHE